MLVESKKRTRLSVEKRRIQLLDAANRVLESRGYHKVVVANIANKAKVSHGTFYHYFTDKENIYTEIFKSLLPVIMLQLSQVDHKSVKSEGDLYKQLYQFYFSMGSLLKDYGIILRELIFVAANSAIGIKQMLDNFLLEVENSLSRIIVEVSGKRPFRKLDPRFTAKAIIGMAMAGVQSAEMLTTDADITQWAQEMARFECGALIKN